MKIMFYSNPRYICIDDKHNLVIRLFEQSNAYPKNFQITRDMYSVITVYIYITV